MYIEGFRERLMKVCVESGMSKSEIARKCGFNRKILSPDYDFHMLSSGYVAKFCEVTHTDANWLLGISRGDR